MTVIWSGFGAKCRTGSAVYVDDNQSVNKGDHIVELDPRDFDAGGPERRSSWQA